MIREQRHSLTSADARRMAAWGSGERRTNPKRSIDWLIEAHTAMYPDPERRQWVEKRLRAWWEGRDG